MRCLVFIPTGPLLSWVPDWHVCDGQVKVPTGEGVAVA